MCSETEMKQERLENLDSGGRRRVGGGGGMAATPRRRWASAVLSADYGCIAVNANIGILSPDN